MSELTDNKIKEWNEKFCYKEWYNDEVPNGFEWKVRDTVINEDVEQWLTQAFEEIREETLIEAKYTLLGHVAAGSIEPISKSIDEIFSELKGDK